MNIAQGPDQANTKPGAIALFPTADLTGKEGRLVKITNSTGAKFALPAAVTDFALFVLLSGGPTTENSWAEMPSTNENFRVRLNGTCNPGDVLVLCDPSGGTNAGKVEAVGATGGKYFAVGIAQEAGVDEQLVLCRYNPRVHLVATAFTGNTPASTGATNSSPYGFTGAAQADALVANVREMRAALIAAGIMASN